jgi:hypothetical protein
VSELNFDVSATPSIEEEAEMVAKYSAFLSRKYFVDTYRSRSRQQKRDKYEGIRLAEPKKSEN